MPNGNIWNEWEAKNEELWNEIVVGAFGTTETGEQNEKKANYLYIYSK